MPGEPTPKPSGIGDRLLSNPGILGGLGTALLTLFGFAFLGNGVGIGALLTAAGAFVLGGLTTSHAMDPVPAAPNPQPNPKPKPGTVGAGTTVAPAPVAAGVRIDGARIERAARLEGTYTHGEATYDVVAAQAVFTRDGTEHSRTVRLFGRMDNGEFKVAKALIADGEGAFDPRAALIDVQGSLQRADSPGYAVDLGANQAALTGILQKLSAHVTSNSAVLTQRVASQASSIRLWGVSTGNALAQQMSVPRDIKTNEEAARAKRRAPLFSSAIPSHQPSAPVQLENPLYFTFEHQGVVHEATAKLHLQFVAGERYRIGKITLQGRDGKTVDVDISDMEGNELTVANGVGNAAHALCLSGNNRGVVGKALGEALRKAYRGNYAALGTNFQHAPLLALQSRNIPDDITEFRVQDTPPQSGGLCTSIFDDEKKTYTVRVTMNRGGKQETYDMEMHLPFMVGTSDYKEAPGGGLYVDRIVFRNVDNKQEVFSLNPAELDQKYKPTGREEGLQEDVQNSRGRLVINDDNKRIIEAMVRRYYDLGRPALPSVRQLHRENAAAAAAMVGAAAGGPLGIPLLPFAAPAAGKANMP